MEISADASRPERSQPPAGMSANQDVQQFFSIVRPPESSVKRPAFGNLKKLKRNAQQRRRSPVDIGPLTGYRGSGERIHREERNSDEADAEGNQSCDPILHVLDRLNQGRTCHRRRTRMLGGDVGLHGLQIAKIG